MACGGVFSARLAELADPFPNSLAGFPIERGVAVGPDKAGEREARSDEDGRDDQDERDQVSHVNRWWMGSPRSKLVMPTDAWVTAPGASR